MNITPDPLPWAVVDLRTEIIAARHPTEWSALNQASRFNNLARRSRVGDGCVFTVDLAPREPLFRFTLRAGGAIEQPGLTVEVALMRMQRHPEEFKSIEQLPYTDDTAERIE